MTTGTGTQLITGATVGPPGTGYGRGVDVRHTCEGQPDVALMGESFDRSDGSGIAIGS